MVVCSACLSYNNKDHPSSREFEELVRCYEEETL